MNHFIKNSLILKKWVLGIALILFLFYGTLLWTIGDIFSIGGNQIIQKVNNHEEALNTYHQEFLSDADKMQKRMMK